MAVKIRLTKLGKKGKPFYRIVATDSRRKRDGKFLEILGFFNPGSDPPKIKINQKRVEYWLARGAKVSEGVRKLKIYEKTS